MKRTILTPALALLLGAALVPAARADFEIRVPFVHIRVGRPTIIRAPFVRLVLPGRSCMPAVAPRSAVVLPGDENYVLQEVSWAAAASGVLYVAHHHRTYAKSSGGMNGYITAIDMAAGKLLWRSAPLVSNSVNFASSRARSSLTLVYSS